MNLDVIVYDILKAAVAAMSIECNFQAGRSYQIMQKLNEADNSITLKDKYPLIAVQMPFIEERGRSHYALVRLPRIVIAGITEVTDDIDTRYASNKTFKQTLYPCYYELLKQLAYSPYIIGGDPDAFVHSKMDNPGTQPIGQNSTDYIDAIEILGLELLLTQIKNC